MNDDATPDAPEPPFWSHGLRFTCKAPACHECCSGRHGPGHVWVDDADVARLAAHLEVSEEAFARAALRLTPRGLSLQERAGGDCLFLEPDGRCRVYEARPTQCRTYPFWPHVVASEARWREEACRCPGIEDEGEHVPAERIRRYLEQRLPRREEGGRPPPARGKGPSA